MVNLGGGVRGFMANNMLARTLATAKGCAWLLTRASASTL